MVRAWSAIASGDRLPDPPRRVGRELVAAAVLELVDRLHQADVAFLDQVEELQAAVGVFLGDGDDEAQVGLDHFLLRLPRLALALLHAEHDLAELADLQTRELGQRMDLAAQVLDAVLLLGNEVLPALAGKLRDAVEPARIELRAGVVAQEVLAADAVAVAETEQAAFIRDELLVDVVELLDERVDAQLVQPQRLHLEDDLVLQLLVLALLRRRQRLVLQPVLDVLLLQAAQLLVLVGDLVEGLDHARLQLGLDGRKRHRVLELVVVHVGFGRSLGRDPSPRRRRLPGGTGSRRAEPPAERQCSPRPTTASAAQLRRCRARPPPAGRPRRPSARHPPWPQGRRRSLRGR